MESFSCWGITKKYVEYVDYVDNNKRLNAKSQSRKVSISSFFNYLCASAALVCALCL